MQLVEALRRRGIQMSTGYLSQLREGRGNPSAGVLAAVAGFFRVDVRFFTDDAYHDGLTRELVYLAALRDDGVRRMAIRTAGCGTDRSSLKH